MLLTCNFDYSVVYRVVKLSEYCNFIAPSVCFKLLFIFASFSCLIDFAAFLADIYLFVGDGRSNFKVKGLPVLARLCQKTLNNYDFETNSHVCYICAAGSFTS